MSSRRQKRCIDPSNGAPVVWVTHGRTQHMAFLLETKDDRMYVRWASNMAKEWVAASNVTTDVEGRGSRRKGPGTSSNVTSPPLAEDKPQRKAATAARSKMDSINQQADNDEEEEKEFDWFPTSKSKDQNDKVSEDVERVKAKASKLEGKQKSSEAVAVADESATALLSNDRIPKKRKRNKRKRGNAGVCGEHKSAKMPKQSRTGGPMKGDVEIQNKTAHTKTREVIDPATKLSPSYSAELVTVVVGTSVAKRTKKNGWISGHVESVDGSTCCVTWNSGKSVHIDKERVVKLLYDADTSHYSIGTRVKKRFSNDNFKSGKVVSLDDSLYHILYKDQTTEVVGTSEMDHIVKPSDSNGVATPVTESPGSASKKKIQTPGESTGSEAGVTAGRNNRNLFAMSTLTQNDTYETEQKTVSSKSTTPKDDPKPPTLSTQLGFHKRNTPRSQSTAQRNESDGTLSVKNNEPKKHKLKKKLESSRKVMDPPDDDGLNCVEPKVSLDENRLVKKSFSPSDTASRIHSLASQLQRISPTLPPLDARSGNKEATGIANNPSPTELEVAEDPAPTELEVAEVPAPIELEVAEVPSPLELDVAEVPSPVELDVAEVPSPVELDVAEVPKIPNPEEPQPAECEMIGLTVPNAPQETAELNGNIVPAGASDSSETSPPLDTAPETPSNDLPEASKSDCIVAEIIEDGAPSTPNVDASKHSVLNVDREAPTHFDAEISLAKDNSDAFTGAAISAAAGTIVESINVEPESSEGADATVATMNEDTEEVQKLPSTNETDEQPRLESPESQQVDPTNDVRESTISKQPEDMTQVSQNNKKSLELQNNGTMNSTVSAGGLGEIETVCPARDETFSEAPESTDKMKMVSNGGDVGPVFDGSNEPACSSDQAKDGSLETGGTAASVEEDNPNRICQIPLDHAVEMEHLTIDAYTNNNDQGMSTLGPADSAADDIVEPDKPHFGSVDLLVQSHPTNISAESPLESETLEEPPSQASGTLSISFAKNETCSPPRDNASQALAAGDATQVQPSERADSKDAQPSRRNRAGTPKEIPQRKPSVTDEEKKASRRTKLPTNPTTARHKKKAHDGQPKRKRTDFDGAALKKHRTKHSRQPIQQVINDGKNAMEPSYLLATRGLPAVSASDTSLSREAQTRRTIMSVLLSRPPDRKRQIAVKKTELGASVADATNTPQENAAVEEAEPGASVADATKTPHEKGATTCTQDNVNKSIDIPAQDSDHDQETIALKQQPTPPRSSALTTRWGGSHLPALVRNQQPGEARVSVQPRPSAQHSWNPSANPMQVYWGYRPAFARPHPSAPRGALQTQVEAYDSSGRPSQATSTYVHPLAMESFLRQQNPSLSYALSQPGIAASLGTVLQTLATNPLGSSYGAQAAAPAYGTRQGPVSGNTATSLAAYFANSKPRKGSQRDPPGTSPRHDD